MIVNPKKLLDTIAKQMSEIEERAPGYRKELLETLSEIIALERQNQEQGINVRAKIYDKCDALGKVLASKSKAEK
jgi:hypothetical protein